MKKSTKKKHLRDYEAVQSAPDRPYELREVADRNLCGGRGGETVERVADADCQRCLDNEEARYLQVEQEVEARNASAGLEHEATTEDADAQSEPAQSEPAPVADARSVREEYEEAQTQVDLASTDLAEVVDLCEWWREIYEDARLAEVWARYRVTAQELERQVLATDKAADLVELRANVRARRALHEAIGDPFESRRAKAQATYEAARKRLEALEEAYPLLIGGQDLAADLAEDAA